MTVKEILNELSISVACLLDEDNLITAEARDIHHIQDLITRLEYEQWKREQECT